MGGGPQTTTDNRSQSSPWQPAVPQLQTLLDRISGLNTGVTANQNTAINSLWSGANGVPSFAPQATGTANNLFGGGGANNQAPFQMDAYNKMNASLSPLTDPNNLNPMNTPGFSDALRTMNSDVSNSVNDRFAAAGRDLSPGNSTALARGLSQGEGGLIASQYNANAGNLLGSTNALYNAGAGTAGALTNFNQLGNTNRLAAMGAAAGVPGLAMAPGQAQFSAANMGQGLPGANLGALSSLLTPIAALGSQSSGSSTSTTSTPLWQQLAGLGVTAAGMAMGNPGSYMSAGSSLMGGLGSSGGLFGGPSFGGQNNINAGYGYGAGFDPFGNPLQMRPSGY